MIRLHELESKKEHFSVKDFWVVCKLAPFSAVSLLFLITLGTWKLYELIKALGQ